MSSLRSRVIRTAHKNPKLRNVLLPLLKEAKYTTYRGKTFPVDAKAVQAAIQVGRPGTDWGPSIMELEVSYEPDIKVGVEEMDFKPSIKDCSWEYAAGTGRGSGGWTFNLVGDVLYEVSLSGGGYKTVQNMKVVDLKQHFPLELDTYDLEDVLPDEIRRQGEGA